MSGKHYNLCITGPIGVGKSTMLNSLKQFFSNYNIQELPEYLGIDIKHGQTMLERKINGELSNLTFQNYVIDMYKMKLKELSDDFDIRLCERIPEDSVYCFSNLSNFDGELSDFELYVLKERFDKLKNQYNLPSYGDKQTEFTIVDACNFIESFGEIVNIVTHDLEQGITKRVIGLTAPFEIVYERIVKRARNGEEKYDKAWLKTITDFYDKLYHYIKTDRNRLNRFTCVGMLI